MLKNKILTLLICFVLSGCTRDERSLWSFFRVDTLDRNPAEDFAVDRPKCFVDRMKDEIIQGEVNQFQAKYQKGVPGNYENGSVTLSDLPSATLDSLHQDLFLDKKISKSWILVDQRSVNCKDLSCIINKLYENSSDEGLLHYWYFLKTGYTLGAINAYPWVNADNTNLTFQVPSFPIEKYLFDRDELKAWWYQANLLPKSMLHMPSLSSIHRIPHGYTPPEWIRSETSQICGWAHGWNTGGTILLGDRCLHFPLGSKPYDTAQNFYVDTTHEMGHRLSDWNFSNNNSHVNFIETEPEFLSLSKWTHEELQDEKGNAQSRWIPGASNDIGWVSNYSKTTPAEDFAEDVGMFRTRAEWMFSRAPQKYEYIKRKIFDGKGYTLTDLRLQYIDSIKSSVVNRASDWLSACLVEAPTVPELTPRQVKLSSAIEIDLPLDHSVISCIHAQFALNLERLARDLRYNEPEGCQVLDKFENDILLTSASEVISDLSHYLKTDRKLIDLLQGVRTYRAAVMQEFDGRALFLSCQSSKQSEDCYQIKLQAESDRLYSKFKVLISAGTGNIEGVEKSRFLKLNEYSEIRNQVSQFYNSLFSKISNETDEMVNGVWNECSKIELTMTASAPILEPYSGGANYVHPEILTCLNDKSARAMKKLKVLVENQIGISAFSPDAQTWIDDQVLFSHFKSTFDRRVHEASAIEGAQLDAIKNTVIDSVYTEMTANVSWIPDGSAYSYADCKKTSSAKLNLQIKEDSYRFTITPSIVANLVDQVCERIRQWSLTPAASEVPVTHSSETVSFTADSLNSVWGKLGPLMISSAQGRYEHCHLKRYFTKVMKRFCLFSEPVSEEGLANQSGWGWTRKRAIESWLALPEVKLLAQTKKVTLHQVQELAILRADSERQDFVDSIFDDFIKQ